MLSSELDDGGGDGLLIWGGNVPGQESGGGGVMDLSVGQGTGGVAVFKGGGKVGDGNKVGSQLDGMEKASTG
jgi:hypothetical protein